MKNKLMEEKFLTSLLSNTKSGNLKWIFDKGNMFNSDICYNYKCELNSDSIIKLKVELDGSQNFLPCRIISIWNKKLPGGVDFCHTSENTKVNEIAHQIFLSHTKSMLPPMVSQDSVMEGIINSISSIEDSRDEKINEIIGTKKRWSLF